MSEPITVIKNDHTGEEVWRYDGVVVERAHAKGDVAVRGPASDLLLVAWHRKPVTSVDTFGDVDRAEAVLDLIHVT